MRINLFIKFLFQAYYGGEARCDADSGVTEDYDPSELVCGACSDVSRAQMCPKVSLNQISALQILIAKNH